MYVLVINIRKNVGGFEGVGDGVSIEGSVGAIRMRSRSNNNFANLNREIKINIIKVMENC